MPLIKRHRWLLVCLACIAPLYFVWTSTNSMGYFADDGPSYLMMARHYSPYIGESRVNAEYAATSRFPPLYPLALAWAGTATDLHAVHILTTVFFMLGLVAYYGWLIILRIAPNQAALLVMLLAVLPGSWLTGLEVQSEYLFLLLSLLALAFLAKYQHDRRDELLYAAAILVATVALTRTIGVTLFAPLLLVLWRAPRRAAAFSVVIALLPLLTWHLLHRSKLGYGEALSSIYGHHPWRVLLTQIVQELPALRDGFTEDFRHSFEFPRLVTDLLGSLCLIAGLWRAIKLETDGVYLVAYLAILLVWPYPEEAKRFLWVVIPVLLGQLLMLSTAILHRRPDSRLPRLAMAVTAAAVLSMALPSISIAADRYNLAGYGSLPSARGFRSWYDADLAQATHTVDTEITMIDAMRRIRTETPSGDCVIAIRIDLINYYAERRSVLPPLNSVPDPYFQSQLRAPGCRYVFMSPATHMMFPLPLHPAQRLENNFRILDYTEVLDPPPGNGNVICILAELL